MNLLEKVAHAFPLCYTLSQTYPLFVRVYHPTNEYCLWEKEQHVFRTLRHWLISLFALDAEYRETMDAMSDRAYDLLHSNGHLSAEITRLKQDIATHEKQIDLAYQERSRFMALAMTLASNLGMTVGIGKRLDLPLDDEYNHIPLIVLWSGQIHIAVPTRDLLLFEQFPHLDASVERVSLEMRNERMQWPYGSPLSVQERSHDTVPMPEITARRTQASALTVGVEVPRSSRRGKPSKKIALDDF